MGVLTFSSAPALASKPEAPEVAVFEISSKSATLHGVLNPNAVAPAEAGTYQFVYRASTQKQCKGSGETKTPEPPNMSTGLEPPEGTEYEAIGGLTAGTEYAVCLVVTEAGKTEPTVSAPFTFKTSIPPEAPEIKPASPVAGRTATLHGVVDPHTAGNPGTYEFLYNTGPSCENGKFSAQGSITGVTPQSVAVEVAGLLPTSTYTFCLRASNEVGESALSSPETFTTTTAAPVITAESSPTVGATTTTLTAQIDPGGESTSYEVQYGPSEAYDSSTPELTLPAASVPVGVEVKLTGLQAGLYHYRFVAGNAVDNMVLGADETFTTAAPEAATSAGLPDSRAYELVSTIENVEVFTPEAGQTESLESELYGELIANVGGFRAAANGGSVAYIGGLPPSGTGGYGVAKNYDGNLYLSARGTNGWEADDIEPVSHNRLIEGLSADLSQQFFNIGEPKFYEAHGGPSGCGESERGELYSRGGGIGAPIYRELVPPSVSGEECELLTFAGVSADNDNTHVLFQSPGAYTPEAVKGEEGTSEKGTVASPAEGFDNLYDAFEGQLDQVNVLPDGKPESAPHAVFGGRAALGERHFEHDFGNAVSADGSRIFWTDLNTEVTPEDPAGTTRLFVRENDSTTVQVDAKQEGAEGTSGGGEFWTASSDGSKVFFTDCSRLTEHSTADAEGGCSREEELHGGRIRIVPTGNDLYEYDVNSGQLTDLTGDSNTADPLGADVQGVVGASEDGSSVSFVANGVLTGKDAEGRKPVAGQPNLYLYEAGKATMFIATLSSDESETTDEELNGANDNEFLGSAHVESPGSLAGDWRAVPGLRSAAVAPAGDAVVFMSTQPLTGYDNHGVVGYRDGHKNEPLYGNQPEVFAYEAGAERISCVSCTPTGAPPAPTAEEWENRVGGHPGISGSSTFSSRFVNRDGTQVYFDSSQPLASRDSNARQDVYEWESDGSNGCEQAAGCVSLLSGGDSPHDAYFLDASESGNDVFFTSREQLLPRALNENVKLYDARVEGGFPETSLACEGTACQGSPPAAPIFATPSSATIGGVDDFVPSAPAKVVVKSLTRAQKLAAALKACRREKKKSQRAACEKAARKRYGAAKRAKKTSNDRRAK